MINLEDETYVENVICSTDLGTSLDMSVTVIHFSVEDVKYDPNSFPGLVSRLDDPDVVVLLFGSGKVLVTSAGNPGDAAAAVDRLTTWLAEENLTA